MDVWQECDLLLLSLLLLYYYDDDDEYRHESLQARTRAASSGVSAGRGGARRGALRLGRTAGPGVDLESAFEVQGS